MSTLKQLLHAEGHSVASQLYRTHGQDYLLPEGNDGLKDIQQALEVLNLSYVKSEKILPYVKEGLEEISELRTEMHNFGMI